MGFMALVVVVSALLAGGHVDRLAALRLRCRWVIVTALVMQVLITEGPHVPRVVAVSLHLISYEWAGGAIWANRRVPGLLVLGAGALVNGVVIALNGGTLPASHAALVSAGLAVDQPGFANSGVVDHPLLPWLGDVVATPAWLPFRNVISVGDVLIIVGAAILAHWGTGSAVAQLGDRVVARLPAFRPPVAA